MAEGIFDDQNERHRDKGGSWKAANKQTNKIVTALDSYLPLAESHPQGIQENSIPV